LFIVILTHGSSKNKIHAKDFPFEAQLLWEPFLGKDRKNLNGKPKIFFIQACRRDVIDLEDKTDASFDNAGK
jgi:hypothetical protein